jgi:SAM-dependent methyltransferase
MMAESGYAVVPTAGVVLGTTPAAYQIVQIRPEGYEHSEALTEVAETLYHGLRRLGVKVFYREAPIGPARPIVFGAHLLEATTDTLSGDAIIYNSEQIFAGSEWLSSPYMSLLRSHWVWDYSAENTRRLLEFGVPIATHVPLGYVPELSRIGPVVEDIDVLFYGCINPRRRAVLEALRGRGLKVAVVSDCYGEQRDRLIARAKIVLSVHYYESKVFEIVRAAYLFTNFKAVVAECGADTAVEPDIRAAICGVSYDEIVDACVRLLRDDAARRALAARGHEVFSARPAESILARTLRLPETDRPGLSVPRVINLGSGKDFRSGMLNLDVSEAWGPDAVVDISDAAVVGSTVRTERFGALVLRENYFDAIVANDVLEHIPDLVSAMTNCLRLLRPGGRFEIAVPYDLSLGAWQDPTHVRAFNENSWLYYTDWHWYLGWTEMRFDVVSLEFKPSAVGMELAKLGKTRDEIVRTPRAIDNLAVVLRKRYLQDSEAQAAIARQPRRAR